jgi:alkylhydroperoxidase family enzyme
MTVFTYHTKETAPAESLPLMEQSFKTYGFVPKLHQVMAEAPITYEAYLNTYNLFHDASNLSPLERQVVMMTSNYENRCHYCTAGHSLVMKWEKMPEDFIEALREGRPLADKKLEALRAFSRLLIEKRGRIGDEELQKFFDAGYTRQQALEVLTGLAAKLLSNFTNALAHTELDEPVKPLAWVHPDDRK